MWHCSGQAPTSAEGKSCSPHPPITLGFPPVRYARQDLVRDILQDGLQALWVLWRACATPEAAASSQAKGCQPLPAWPGCTSGPGGNVSLAPLTIPQPQPCPGCHRVFAGTPSLPFHSHPLDAHRCMPPPPIPVAHLAAAVGVGTPAAPRCGRETAQCCHGSPQ